MRFLFRLDLSLHTGAGNFFGILIFGTKHGVNAVCRRRRELLYCSVYLCDIYACFAGMRTCLISAPRIRRIVTRVHRFVFRWNPAVRRKRNSVPEFRWISDEIC